MVGIFPKKTDVMFSPYPKRLAPVIVTVYVHI